MVPHIATIIAIVTAAGALASIAYYALCLWSAAAFVRKRKLLPATANLPVSILKPCKGTDPEMYESFRSHCLQDYPEYEIIFGVRDADDPAVALVDRLKTAFPERTIRLLVCSKDLGANVKVSNLAQMLPEASYDQLIVNDSDIRVDPDYLRRVLAPLQDSGVGLVTCLYRAVTNSTLGSRMEALGISSDFCPGVLVARQLEGIKFGLGSTLAFRRKDLRAIGGFEAVVDYLADDYQIGSRIAALGQEVALSDVVVETFLPHYTFREFFDHQMRWARTVRDSRFWGYVGLGMTFGLPWSFLALIFSGGAAWAWVLLAFTFAMRAAVTLVTGKWVLGESHILSYMPLLPLRDGLALLVWILSFAGHTVTWRGDSFRLQRGKLTPMEPSAK